MRLHITVDDAVVEALDRRVGPRGRSRYIVAALKQALEDEWRWDEIEASFGTISDHGHDWDEDPAAWVHAQRFGDPERVG